jgi:hypothetical protein
MRMPTEFKMLGLIVAGLLAARVVILALDAIAETVERRSLYR